LRLLFICFDQPDYFGGPIVHARRLLPELQRRGHEVHCLLFFAGDEAPSAGHFEQHGIHCRLRAFGLATEEQVRWILEQVSAIRPDVFVPNMLVAGFYAARWVREAGIPTVAVHRSDDEFHWAVVDEFVVGEREWAVSGLVCVSDAFRRSVESRRPPHTRLCTIPSGVPIPAFQSAQTGPLKLVYAGRLAQEQKRVHEMVDALALLMECRDDVTATLIGSGNEWHALHRRIAQYDLGNRIFLGGSVPGEQIQEELSRHDAFILLSDYEGTPIAAMDAMAAGLVPVCLDIPGGVRELVIHERTGLLVRDRAGDFVAAITRLADDPALRRRLAANGKDHVRRHFSLATAAERWERFCTDLLANRGPAGAVRIPETVSLPPPRPAFRREDFRIRSEDRRSRTRNARSEIGPDPIRPGQNPPGREFLDPRLRADNLDTAPMRGAILHALSARLDRFEGTLLDVGCGDMPYRSLLTSPPGKVSRYLGLDLDISHGTGTPPDLTWQDGRIPLADDSIDCAVCTEVLEHLLSPAPVLREIHRVLKPGGLLFFTTPFLWPLHEVPFDEYRYTPYSLRRLLGRAGFVDIEIAANGGWDASLAQMLGLWVRRRPMTGWKRNLLSLLLRPVIGLLLRHDRRIRTLFKESQMIMAISGTARKPREIGGDPGTAAAPV
jgi:colanic acid/amylovoran biosynthesis glycosyltransferase